MSRAAKITLVTLAVFVMASVGAAFAYDEAKRDQIAPGVMIAGVEVGGHDTKEAKKLLRDSVVEPLMRPVKVMYEDELYTLTPDQLEMDADLKGMLDEAVAESRQGGLPTRLIRYATDGEVSANLQPRISYSDKALDEEIERIVGSIDREAVDASIEPSGSSITPTKEQNGFEVHEEKLREDVQQALQDGAGPREVTADGEVTEPEVTTEELATAYPTYVTVDRSNFKLTLWKNLEKKKTYPIAVGGIGYDTPTGVYEVSDKQVNPTWNVPTSEWTGDLAGQSIPPGPGNPLKARWIGIADGAGIHGTDDIGSLGSAASHGCVRMAVPDVIELYDQVPHGTPIYVG